ncbi:M81 family metallopeptidase [Vibrio parahaemolyticus]|nr:M81 family metallopeptidase [Vibrio parahaemolyticus]
MTKNYKIALAGMYLEMNSFAEEAMGKSKITGNMTTGFQGWSAEDLLKEYRGSKTYMGGYIDAFDEHPDIEVIPATFWSFVAGGPIAAEDYQTMKKDILDRLGKAMPLDAVALCLHGAGAAEGVEDAETDLCVAIRELVGPDTKIVSAQDHHGCLSDEDVKLLDLITIVYQYPHVDMYDAAYRAAKMLPAMLKGDIKPYGYFERLPMVLAPQSTMDGCLFAPIMKKVLEFAQRDGILEFSLNYGFPWADVSNNQYVVNAWAETPDLAEKTAKEFAALLWNNRERFVAKTLSAEEAVQQALTELVKQGRVLEEETRAMLHNDATVVFSDGKEEEARSFGFLPDEKHLGPVVIAEKSDNPGGGALGDATHVLRELIKYQVKQACVCTINDPQTVQKAVQAGVGQIIDVELGGKGSTLAGEPIKAKAYVKSISDGRYTVVSPMGAGTKFDVGPAVGLLIEGIDVAVISGTMQPFDAGQMKMVGFDPADYRVVVLKSSSHFRAWWTDIASTIIDCDPPGICSAELSTLKYKNKTQKVFPLDPDVVYPEVTQRH